MLTAEGLHRRQETGIAEFVYIAVGTGSQTPSEVLTALVTEVARAAVSATSVVGALAAISALFTNNQANGVLTELGIYDLSSGGTLLQYELITPSQTKTSDDGMMVTVPTTLINEVAV